MENSSARSDENETESQNLKVPSTSIGKNAWHSESNLDKFDSSALPVPSFVVTAPTFDTTSEHKFLYFPRKFSFQAFRKFSGSAVSFVRVRAREQMLTPEL